MRILVLSLPLILFCQLGASAQSDKTRLQDLAYLMGQSLVVPGIAEYCDQFVAKNPELVRAGIRWNERHAKVLEAIEREFKRLSSDEKRKLNIPPYKELLKEIESRSDKIGYCKEIVQTINSGDLDFEKRADPAAALSRLGISTK